MHDNKEKEWREHSFLTPTLLHHTPIATLCHPTPSFLPVLFLVYWIFLFSRPGNKSYVFVLWALFFDDSDTHKHGDMQTFLLHCPPLHLTESLLCLCHLDYHKPWHFFLLLSITLSVEQCVQALSLITKWFSWWEEVFASVALAQLGVFNQAKLFGPV